MIPVKGASGFTPCTSHSPVALILALSVPSPPLPLYDIPSGCCFFTGPWTVTRSSLRMLRRVAAFCRPLRPVLLLVSFPRSRSPVVGVLGLCWLRRPRPRLPEAETHPDCQKQGIGYLVQGGCKGEAGLKGGYVAWVPCGLACVSIRTRVGGGGEACPGTRGAAQIKRSPHREDGGGGCCV